MLGHSPKRTCRLLAVARRAVRSGKLPHVPPDWAMLVYELQVFLCAYIERCHVQAGRVSPFLRPAGRAHAAACTPARRKAMRAHHFVRRQLAKHKCKSAGQARKKVAKGGPRASLPEAWRRLPR